VRGAADGVAERVEPLQKRAMLTGGIGWVEMTAVVWMAAVWVATVTMAYRMKEVLAGDSFHRLHLLATRPQNDTSKRRFLVRLAGGETGSGDSAAPWAQAEVVGAMTSGGQAVTVEEGHRWRRRCACGCSLLSLVS
jgi:hypothetical protein